MRNLTKLKLGTQRPAQKLAEGKIFLNEEHQNNGKLMRSLSFPKLAFFDVIRDSSHLVKMARSGFRVVF